MLPRHSCYLLLSPPKTPRLWCPRLFSFKPGILWSEAIDALLYEGPTGTILKTCLTMSLIGPFSMCIAVTVVCKIVIQGNLSLERSQHSRIVCLKESEQARKRKLGCVFFSLFSHSKICPDTQSLTPCHRSLCACIRSPEAANLFCSCPPPTVGAAGARFSLI